MLPLLRAILGEQDTATTESNFRGAGCSHYHRTTTYYLTLKTMKLETEKLLGTLEILARRPFFWDTEKWVNFNVWNLMRSEGCVNLTDVEVALAEPSALSALN